MVPFRGMHRILIVDDHPLYREGMVSALAQRLAEVEVLGAGNAEEGLALLDSSPDVDLVLLDVRLPGMDGFAALALYGERHPSVPRMVVSAMEEPDLVRRALEGGASGFIPKSLSLAAVAQAIRSVLDGGVFAPPLAPVPGPSDAGLTLRQLEVLKLLGEGYTNKEIARALEITERTAKAHVAAIFESLGVDNRTQAVVAAQRAGLLGRSADR